MRAFEKCYDCNIYCETCDGRKFLKLEKSKQGYVSCANRAQTAENTKSPLQGQAFVSLYRAKVKNGMSLVGAFAEAIVQSSDDVFKKISSEQIEQYRQELEMMKEDRNQIKLQGEQNERDNEAIECSAGRDISDHQLADGKSNL